MRAFFLWRPDIKPKTYKFVIYNIYYILLYSLYYKTIVFYKKHLGFWVVFYIVVVFKGFKD